MGIAAHGSGRAPDRARSGAGGPPCAARGISLALLIAIALSPGCLLESHEVEDPLPLARFCVAFFDALCEPLEDCGCSASLRAECEAERGALCEGFPSATLGRAVDEGRVRYDGTAAAALVRRLRGRGAGCEGFVEALDWRVRDLLSLGGVFEGSRAAGEACEDLGFELVSECGGGSCGSSAAGRTCRAAVGLGEVCDALHSCADLESTLTAATGIEGLSLRCEREEGVDTGVCARWREAGEGCASPSECWTGRCEAARCASVSEAASCASSRECASAHCDRATSTCQPGDAAVGESCTDATACASHVCAAGLCEPMGCGTF